MNKLDWNEYFMNVANLISKRSTCSRLHVGCVVVVDNRIISSGYNGFLPGAPHVSIVRDNHEQSTVHAEQNAITDCAKRGVSMNDSVCYITHYPCIHCAKLLAASGVQQIYYANDYKNDPLVEKIISSVGIKCIKLDAYDVDVVRYNLPKYQDPIDYNYLDNIL